MFFGSKYVKVAKMCILHIYTKADANALRASIFGIVKLLICYILASNHNREALPRMPILKEIFTTELQ